MGAVSSILPEPSALAAHPAPRQFLTRLDVARLFSGQPIHKPVKSIRLGGNDVLRASVGRTVTYRFYHLDPTRMATD